MLRKVVWRPVYQKYFVRVDIGTIVFIVGRKILRGNLAGRMPEDFTYMLDLCLFCSWQGLSANASYVFVFLHLFLTGSSYLAI